MKGGGEGKWVSRKNLGVPSGGEKKKKKKAGDGPPTGEWVENWGGEVIGGHEHKTEIGKDGSEVGGTSPFPAAQPIGI